MKQHKNVKSRLRAFSYYALSNYIAFGRIRACLAIPLISYILHLTSRKSGAKGSTAKYKPGPSGSTKAGRSGSVMQMFILYIDGVQNSNYMMAIYYQHDAQNSNYMMAI